MSQVNIAIIGLGFGAEFIPIYQRHPQANIYAICQRNEESLNKIGDKYGVQKRYSNFEDVLRDPEVSAVHINTPIPNHGEQAIAALEALKRPCTVNLYTDSSYLRDGITKWIINWKRNGWKTAAKKPVKNVDLWQRLEAAIQRHEIAWRWVKGHAGDPGNEAADALARQGLDAYGRI